MFLRAAVTQMQSVAPLGIFRKLPCFLCCMHCKQYKTTDLVLITSFVGYWRDGSKVWGCAFILSVYFKPENVINTLELRWSEQMAVTMASFWSLRRLSSSHSLMHTLLFISLISAKGWDYSASCHELIPDTDSLISEYLVWLNLDLQNSNSPMSASFRELICCLGIV